MVYIVARAYQRLPYFGQPYQQLFAHSSECSEWNFIIEICVVLLLYAYICRNGGSLVVQIFKDYDEFTINLENKHTQPQIFKNLRLMRQVIPLFWGSSIWIPKYLAPRSNRSSWLSSSFYPATKFPGHTTWAHSVFSSDNWSQVTVHSLTHEILAWIKMFVYPATYLVEEFSKWPMEI